MEESPFTELVCQEGYGKWQDRNTAFPRLVWVFGGRFFLVLNFFVLFWVFLVFVAVVVVCGWVFVVCLFVVVVIVVFWGVCVCLFVLFCFVFLLTPQKFSF